MSNDKSGIRNIGPVSMGWLRAVGIHTREDLEKTGAVEAYERVRAIHPGAGLNLLYALHAALQNVHWASLTPAERESLKSEVKG